MSGINERIGDTTQKSRMTVADLRSIEQNFRSINKIREPKSADDKKPNEDAHL
jgi:hypothetical protein